MIGVIENTIDFEMGIRKVGASPGTRHLAGSLSNWWPFRERLTPRADAQRIGEKAVRMADWRSVPLIEREQTIEFLHGGVSIGD
jgi:hypothetical protein